VRQIELTSYAADTLERLNIPYAVVGSVASSAWGEPRLTRDVDIVIRLAADQVEALCAAFPADEFYVSRAAAAEAAQRLGQFNVIHPTSGNKIDFMVVGMSGWAAAQIARRKRVNLDAEHQVYLAAPEDVILGKLVYYHEGGSDKHLRDIAGILDVSGAALDRDYISQCAAKLHVADDWHAIRRGYDPL
jgi:hypothetical protein